MDAAGARLIQIVGQIGTPVIKKLDTVIRAAGARAFMQVMLLEGFGRIQIGRGECVIAVVFYTQCCVQPVQVYPGRESGRVQLPGRQ